MTKHQSDKERIQKLLARSDEYYGQTNDIIGVIGFTIALACVATENPAFYGQLAAIFILFVWLCKVFPSTRDNIELKKLGHDGGDTVFKAVLKTLPALVSWFFIIFVAFGCFDTHGWRKDGQAFTRRTVAALLEQQKPAAVCQAASLPPVKSGS